jgi:hypothetical protein
MRTPDPRLGMPVRWALAWSIALLCARCGDGRAATPSKDAGHTGDAGGARDAGESHDAAPRDATTDASGWLPPPADASPVMQLADGVVGSACSADADCGAGGCMLNDRTTHTPFREGYCTALCATDAHCGENGVCVPNPRGSFGTCYLGCSSDADCTRDGYRCRAPASGGARCLPGPKPLPDGVLGNTCTSNEQCGDSPGSCNRASREGSVTTEGYCTQSCAVDADCGAGGKCVSSLNLAVNLSLGFSVGACFEPCTPDGGCRQGFSCGAPSGSNRDELHVCSPAYSGADAGVF